MMTLPRGAPSAVTSKKTLTVAIVLWIGWIRVDWREDASVDLLEGGGRVKPGEQPRLKHNVVRLRPPSWSSVGIVGRFKGRRMPGRSNLAGRGPRAGRTWQIFVRKRFPFFFASCRLKRQKLDTFPELSK